jgi:hypothetical protein
MTFDELAGGSTSTEYPFTLAQIALDAKGEGEGKLGVATKFMFDKEKNMITMQSYSTEPVSLRSVRILKK